MTKFGKKVNTFLTREKFSCGAYARAEQIVSDKCYNRIVVIMQYWSKHDTLFSLFTTRIYCALRNAVRAT